MLKVFFFSEDGENKLFLNNAYEQPVRGREWTIILRVLYVFPADLNPFVVF
jgi:hypothetical protein